MKVAVQLPAFERASEWLNGRVTTRQTKGHPTLVHFWSISSEAAKTNLAQVAQIRDQRRREGVRVVAVHVPQSQAEKDPKAVRDAMKYQEFFDAKELPVAKEILAEGKERL